MADANHTYVGKLVSNLIKSSPIEFEDLKRFWGLEDELNQLRESLLSISDLLEGSERKQHRKEIANWWFGTLKEEAYEADDLLSQLSYQTTLLQVSVFLYSHFRVVKYRNNLLVVI
ncbi:hypothetical protein M5689_002266 [Euphorbia peplus]|nr:hypothetical protein M5689_002266 [Euphorbia peplus]